MIYLRAASMDDALLQLRENPGYLLLSGCTDVAVLLHKKREPQGVIDITALKELDFIRVEEEQLQIGALTTINEILGSEPVQTHLPLLCSVCELFGSHQIRNLATIGGNIANASPAADLIAPLLALEASVTLRSAEGERTLPLCDLYSGYKRVALEHEIITSVILPLEPHRWYYRKAGPRARLTIAKVSLAVVKKSGGYRISGASLNPYEKRFVHLERTLDNGDWGDEAIKAALEQDVDPSGSMRSSKAYRKRVLLNMLAEALKQIGG